jgi:hypothetical protein
MDNRNAENVENCCAFNPLSDYPEQAGLEKFIFKKQLSFEK